MEDLTHADPGTPEAWGAVELKPLRVVFMGTPDFAAEALTILLKFDAAEVVGVYTQPDRPCGRGQQCKPSPVKVVALENTIPVFQPVNFKDQADIDQLAELKPDVLVVAAYGLILPQSVLDIPALHPLNIHASLLPRWRGAAPIHRAIMAGDAETGVCIMQMEAGLDTGPVLLREATRIGAEETTAELHDRLAVLGAGAITKALSQLDNLTPETQPEDGVTYAEKINKDEARIDWSQPAEVVDRQIRGLSPFPGAWCELDGARVKVLASRLADGEGAAGGVISTQPYVACGAGAVQLLRLQKAGSRAQDATEFMRGTPLPTGTRLT